MKVYNWLDKLASEEQGFYAVMNFLRILYELSLYDNAEVLSSSSFAKIETFSDSRRVQRVQKYIADHYQEDIRLSILADMVGMTSVSFSRFFRLRTGKHFLIILLIFVLALLLVYWWTLHIRSQRYVMIVDLIIYLISIDYLNVRKDVRRRNFGKIIERRKL